MKKTSSWNGWSYYRGDGGLFRLRRKDGERVAIISRNAKMGCYSFELPAMLSCPSHTVGERGSVCDSCYAMKGMYSAEKIIRAQVLRHQFLREALNGNPEFAFQALKAAMSPLRPPVQSRRSTPPDTRRYFRVHSSGDFFSPDYVALWRRIAGEFPGTLFWFPTKVHTRQAFAFELMKLAALPNTIVRPSLEAVGHVPTLYTPLSTTVIEDPRMIDIASRTGWHICPKDATGGTCASNKCRACWAPDLPVAFTIHTTSGRKAQEPVSESVIRRFRDVQDSVIHGRKLGHVGHRLTVRCSRCRQYKKNAEFSLNKSKSRGISNWCKECDAAKRAESR